MDQQQPAIEVEHLTKSFADRVVLSDLSLSIPSGITTIITGPNGTGKSTLLRCMAGLLDFEKGLIRLRGSDGPITLRPGNYRQLSQLRGISVGFVPQDVELWSQWTVLENVWRPQVDIAGKSKPEAIAEATHWLERLQVPPDRWNRIPYGSQLGGLPRLSGGEHRKVAIARALAMKPGILFLDEVEAHLDAEAIAILLRELQDQYFSSETSTVVMVTHRVELLGKCPSRIITLGKT